MKMTKELKKWLIDNAGLKADASDADAKAAAADAFASGKLTAADYAKLTTDIDAKAAESLELKLDQALTAMAKLGTAEAKEKGGVVLPDLNKAFSEGSALDVDAGGQPRVKRAHEWYDGSRHKAFFPKETNKGVTHPYAGEELGEGHGANKRYMGIPSAREKAALGAYIKFSMGRVRDLPGQLKMTDHDKDLLKFALDEMEWGGVIKSNGTGDSAVTGAIELKGRRLTLNEQKALIDDSTSGGLEAAPIVFDDMVITTPLLFGEFYPSVNVVPITRGRRIEGVSIGNVTLQSGGADNDNIDLFTTTSFIAAFDTSIFAVDGAIEIGLDFLSDSPIDVTALVTDSYGRRLLAWLDEQICIGDGTTEPEGITVGSGTTSVSGGSAAPTVGVYESFFFGVPKRYKQGYPNTRIMFGANETTYMRARAIKVGASDERRIFGMTHGDYMLMGHKYGISDAMGNTAAFFANMARFRMYRRLGLTIKATSEGQTLVRKNLMMITCRSRWGGQLEDGGAAAVSSTMQA